MITVGMNYDVLPGKEPEFEAKFSAVIGALNDAAGHNSSRLFRDVDDASSYLIISEWDSNDAFKAFVTSEAFRSVTNWGKAEILRGRPRHQVYGA
jgi:heme-degrading monooxygenase HmoA